jgi:hypothetical protein
MLRFVRVPLAVRPLITSLRDLGAEERRALLDEVLQIPGLMPLLMKPRNKERWTRDDKLEIVRQLRPLTAARRYLVPLALPGGLMLLPVLAWWLDRRRGRRRGT